METTSNHNALRRLILGLSPRERSHLRKIITTKTGREETLLCRLLELMEKKDEYSTNQLLQKLTIRSKTQLSGIKSRLLTEVLNIKVHAGQKENINAALHSSQEQAMILFQNGMFDVAEKLCQKAISIAKKYGKYHFLNDLLYLQNNAIQYKDFKKYSAANPALFEEIKSAAQYQHALAKVRLFFEQIRVLGYRNWLPIEEKELGIIRNMHDELNFMKSEKGFSDSLEKQVLIKLFYLNTKAGCGYLLHEEEECTVACEEILMCWKKETHLISEYSRLFLYSMNVTSYHDFFQNDIRKAQVHLEAYSALADSYLKNRTYFNRFSIIQFNTSIKIFHKTAQYDQVRDLLKKQGQEILRLAGMLLPTPDVLPVLTSIGISYFVLDRWDDAESMIMEAKEKNYGTEREDVLYFTLIFHLLILYEKKEWYRLDSAIDAAYHFLYSRRKMRIFEREMMLFLKRLAIARDRDSERKTCLQFIQRIKQINEKDIPLYSLYFNFPGWVESKIEGISYREYVSRKLETGDPQQKELKKVKLIIT